MFNWLVDTNLHNKADLKQIILFRNNFSFYPL
jgi:hypothetical protein